MHLLAWISGVFFSETYLSACNLACKWWIFQRESKREKWNNFLNFRHAWSNMQQMPTRKCNIELWVLGDQENQLFPKKLFFIKNIIIPQAGSNRQSLPNNCITVAVKFVWVLFGVFKSCTVFWLLTCSHWFFSSMKIYRLFFLVE